MATALALTGPRQRAAQLWRDYPREVAGVGLLGLAATLALAGAASSTPTLEGIRGLGGERSAPPAPPPLFVRQLAPEDALSVNAAIPLDAGPNPAAKAFKLRGAGAETYARALECLTSAVYYEAGNEAADGQKAVAQVVLNRVRHPAFPASVCAVVYQGSTRPTGCQFTFTCDGSLARRPSAAGWARAQKVAEAALKGAVHKPVGWATHYHANYVVPYWAHTLAKNAVVGTHIFYRWEGGWGRPYAFSQRYSAVEPDVAALRTAAVLAEQQQAEQAEVTEAVQEIPGAEALALTPSMRGDKKVGIHFNLAARKAAEEAPRVPYLEKHPASDNLKWSLTGGIVAEQEQEKPLGRSEPAVDSGAAKEALPN